MIGLSESEIEFSTRQIDASGQVQAGPAGRARQVRLPLGAVEAIDLVWVPGGPFMMGSPRGQGYPDELPQHYVHVQPFWMSRSLVTQAQLRAVTGKLLP